MSWFNIAILHKKTFQELTTDELYELLRVRSEVFVVEQDCVYQKSVNAMVFGIDVKLCQLYWHK